MPKNILITGASSGIGEASAKYLVSQGYSVMLVGRNENKLVQLTESLGEWADYCAYDLHDLDNIEEIFKYCESKSFVLDGFVYCAGIGGSCPIRNLDWHFVSDMMTVNCLAFIEMVKFAVDRKYSRKNSSIVVMSSLSSITCYRGSTAYTISKAAINAACRTVSNEILRRGIRINSIMPGYVRTPMMSGTSDEDIRREQPWGYIEPSEIAFLIEYLLSDKAKNITGANIPVSAGMKY